MLEIVAPVTALDPVSHAGREAARERGFEAVTSLLRLEQGWERVHRNGGCAGGDGLTVATFARDAGERLLDLHRALRSGSYRPGPLRLVEIPKASGGIRTLAIPGVADRIAQTAAALVLTPSLDAGMSDVSFGYRTGRSVRMAVRRVAVLRRQGFTWTVDSDIEKYFDSIPHDRLMARLKREIDDSSLLRLFGRWLAGFSPAGTGIPQGAPISPLLANLYLDEVDKAMEGRGVRIVRFADDIVLLCRSEPAAVAARDRLAGHLADLGLRLNIGKTSIVPFDRPLRFLGARFVGSLVFEQPEDVDGAASDLMPALVPPPPPPISLPDDDTRGRWPSAYRAAPGLRVLYVTRPGRWLALRNQSLTVRETDGRELVALPPQRVDRIELWPETGADNAALRLALAHDIEIAFVNGWGECAGTLAPPVAPRAGLHLDQARHALDPDLRLDLARRLVDGRIRNQRALLRRLNRRRGDAQVDAAATTLARVLRHLPVAEDIGVLLGREGEAAAIYWPAFGRCLLHGWSLEYRRRNPPPDPVNLLLSLAARNLYRDIGALAARHGLHSEFGALHATRDGHPALVSDLIEEFRAPLVEGFVAYVLNNRLLAKAHFDCAAPGTVRLAPEGFQRFIGAYEIWLDRPVRSPRTGDSLRWRRLIEEQAVAYARHVRGGTPYEPYALDH